MLLKTDMPTGEKYSCHFEDPHCMLQLERFIYNYMVELNPALFRDMVYLCIGTDRATGDCLGPLVGNRLQDLLPNAKIYGTLQNPVHAVNLNSILKQLDRGPKHPFIIAVDACLGNVDRIGYINVRRGSLRPGTAVNKDLPEVGDFHISGVVNIGGFLEQMVLQNTRLFTVYRMADIIAKSLYMANFKFQQKLMQDTAAMVELQD